MKFLPPVIGLTSLLLLIFSSCSNNPSLSNQGDEKICVTDFRGKEICFDQHPQRIVCLIESSLSGFYMLGADSVIAGVPTAVYYESTAQYYAQLDQRIGNKTLPAPGNWDHVSMESLMAVRPDLVVIWLQQEESIRLIENAGIAVYAVMLKSFDDVKKEILDFGTITGREERAAHLIRYTENELKENALHFSGNKPAGYFMWSQGPLETSGTRSTVQELFDLSGIRNVCTSEEEHLVVNIENLLVWDPDLIVMWNNQTRDPADIIDMTQLQGMKAVKTNRVHELPSVFFCDLWTLKYPFAVRMLTSWAYPGSFTSDDIQDHKQRMLDSLYGPSASGLIKLP